MKDLLQQIRKTIEDSHLYYLALFACLTLPDICGAISSDDGEADGNKYKEWFDKYIAHKVPGLTGVDCYRFRCSMLHQGSTQHPRSTFSRVIFMEPSKVPVGTVHNVSIGDGNTAVLVLDIELFCMAILQGAEAWLNDYQGTKLYEENYSRFMRRYPEGIKPYISGPVIS